MPIFFLAVGVMLVIVGINNRLSDLSALLKEDFKPSGDIASYQTWAVAIILVGSLGYVRALKPVANAFLVLIFITLMLSHKGFVSQLVNTLEGKSNG